MRKIGTKIFSIVMAATLVTSVIPANNYFSSVKTVKATADYTQYSDSRKVDGTILKDENLLKAVRIAITGSSTAEFTVKDMKDYNGDLNLNAYPNIASLEGLGFLRNAKSIDASGLTGVKVIEENEFRECKFSTFKMPPNVTEIKKQAFVMCENLGTINLPSTLKYIGVAAFQNCYKLNNITIPTGIENILDNAFSGCTSLTSIKIPDGINAMVETAGEEQGNGLGANVFAGCTNLNSVIIGDGITTIPAGTFNGCYSLHYINIPSRVTSIRSAAFESSGLVSIDLSKNTGMTTISSNCFSNCQLLVSIKLPTSIVDIENYAFSHNVLYTKNADFLEKLTNLKRIGAYAFNGAGYTSVALPKNVEKIGEAAFSGCSNLETVVIADYDLKDISGGEGVEKRIGERAFAECYSLKNIDLPVDNENSAKENVIIEAEAFDEDANITEIRFPKNTSYIGDNAFRDCGYTIEDDEKDCPYGSYSSVKASVRQLDPKYIKIVDKGTPGAVLLASKDNDYQPYALYGIIENGADTSDTNIQYLVEDPNGKSKLYRQHHIGLKEVDLSQCERLSMGEGVFESCVNLEIARLPEHMTTIPKATFKNCVTKTMTGSSRNYVSKVTATHTNDNWYNGGLRRVYMSPNTTTIGVDAFYGCGRLDMTNNFPTKLVKIEESAFEDCNSLGEIVLPSTLEYIGERAFANTSRKFSGVAIYGKGLYNVDASGANKLKYIGSSAFNGSAIKKFSMNANAPVKRIGSSAFYNAQLLYTVDLSRNVQYIGDYALACCYRLKSVTIPDICTLSNIVCKGKTKDSIKNYDHLIPQDELSGYAVININNVPYYTTRAFALTIVPNNSKLTVRENSDYVIPLATIHNSDKLSCYKKVKIGSYTFDWNYETSMLDGDESMSPLAPSVVKNENVIVKDEYQSGTKISNKNICFTGRESKQNIAVNIEEELAILVDGDSKFTLTPAVTYSVDVTKNPCKEIKVDNKYHISYKETKNGVKVTPELVPTYDDSECTDVIEWTLVSGEDVISMNVASDKKSATFLPVDNNKGSAKIRVRAGSVTKEFYVYSSIAATGISVSPTKLDLLLTGSAKLDATLKYSTTDIDSGDVDTYPDGVSFKSSDEKIVKVVEQEDSALGSTVKLVPVAVGTATITVKALAGKKETTCKVSVTTEGLSLNMFNDKLESIPEKSTLVTRNKAATKLVYRMTESTVSNEVAYKIEDEKIISVEATKGKINGVEEYYLNIKGKLEGTTGLTIYPKAGSPEKNGVKVIIKVVGDVNYINLVRQEIPVGSTKSIFGLMKNVFGTEISQANDYSFGRLTDNRIEFVSSDPTVATVDKYGNVTAKSIPATGTVSIKCTAYNGDEIKKSGSVTVTIVKAIQGGGGNSGSGSGSGQYYIVAPDGTKTYAPIKGKITKLKRGKKKIKVSWKKLAGAAGYQISMSKKKKKGYKIIKTIHSPSARSFTKKKLKRKKRYYFKVRGFAKNSYGQIVFGKWSAAKNAKAK